MPIREAVDTPKPKRRKIEVVAAPPVPDPVYAPVLLHVDEHPPRVRDYVSPGDAGKCARQISYKLGGVEPDVAMGGTSGFVMAMGQFVGEYVAEGIRRDNPKALVVAEQPLHDYVATAEDDKIEPVIVETSNGDLPVIGFVDVTVEEEHLHDVVEVKSTGQYSFTKQTGWGYRSGAPEGPKPTHLGQGSIYGKLRAAKRLVMLLVNRDPLSAKQAPDDLARMAAEWHYTPEEFVPLADQELARLRGILTLVQDGTAASRRIPGVPAEIDDPTTGAWALSDGDGTVIEMGVDWNCLYCSYQERCDMDGPGRVPLEAP